MSWEDLRYHEHCVDIVLNNPEDFGHKQVDRAIYIVECLKKDQTDNNALNEKAEQEADDWLRLSTGQMVD
jgi:hypothetical protein